MNPIIAITLVILLILLFYCEFSKRDKYAVVIGIAIVILFVIGILLI